MERSYLDETRFKLTHRIHSAVSETRVVLYLLLTPSLPVFFAAILLGPGLAFLAMWQRNPVFIIQSYLEDDIMVSGWYGPGAWLAFLITLFSVIITTVHNFVYAIPEDGWDMNLFAVVVYLLVSSADLMRRTLQLNLGLENEMPRDTLLSLSAAATVVHVGLAVIGPVGGLAVLGGLAGFQRRSAVMWLFLFLCSYISAAVFNRACELYHPPREIEAAEHLFQFGPFYHSFPVFFVAGIGTVGYEIALYIMGAVCAVGHLISYPADHGYWRSSDDNISCYTEEQKTFVNASEWYSTNRCYAPHQGCTCSLITLLISWLKNLSLAVAVFVLVGVGFTIGFSICAIWVWFCFAVPFLWPSIWLMMDPRSRWFPYSGISLTEMDQAGALLTALAVGAFRLGVWMWKVFKQTRSITADMV